MLRFFGYVVRRSLDWVELFFGWRLFLLEVVKDVLEIRFAYTLLWCYFRLLLILDWLSSHIVALERT